MRSMETLGLRSIDSVAQRISLVRTKQLMSLKSIRAGSMIAVLQFLVELWPAELNLGHAACVRVAAPLT